MWSFRNKTQEFLDKSKLSIVVKFGELCNDPNFKKTLSGGLQKKGSILRRRILWTEKLEAING